MAASDEEDIKPTKMKKRNVKTDMEHPKLAIVSLMSKFYLISWLVWIQVGCICSSIYMNGEKVR